MSEKKKPTEVFFQFAFTYKLTKAGLRESLLQGGDGREAQRVTSQISLADAEALGIDLSGYGGLKSSEMEIRTAELRYPNSSVWGNVDVINFLPAYYDAPQEFQDLLADALRYHAERQIVFDGLKTEWEAIKQAALAGEAEFSAYSSGAIQIARGSKVFKFDGDPELNALVAERDRQRKEAEAKARTEREAEDSARKKAKVNQIAAWVAVHGSDSQRERFVAGLFPESEAIEVIEADAFAPLSSFAFYERIASGEVIETCSERCRCASGYDEETCSIKCESNNVETVTDAEWRQIKRIVALLPEASVTLKLHCCQCDDNDCDHDVGEGVIERKGLYVKLQVGAFTFNREYAVA